MSECKSYQRYEDCFNGGGDGLTKLCGAYVPKASPPEKIITYPQMSETIKDLLRRIVEPMDLYILARIEELEQANAELSAAWRDACGVCGFNDGCEYEDCAVCRWRMYWRPREQARQADAREGMTESE